MKQLLNIDYSRLELQILASVLGEGFSRKIPAKKRNAISVKVQPGMATLPKSVAPSIQVRTDIPGTASVQISLSRKATLELIQALQDALAQFELDSVHES